MFFLHSPRFSCQFFLFRLILQLGGSLMKTPTSSEQANLASRAARSISSFPAFESTGGQLLSPGDRIRFQKKAEQILKRNRAVGCSLILCQGNHSQIFSYGHARLHPPEDVTPGTPFRLASVTKLVTTLGILSLAEDGLLSLDADLSEIFGFPVRNPHFPDLPVTLRMLLTHTAGITDGDLYNEKGLSGRATTRELILSDTSWLSCAPGEAFHYSNLGAGIAGAAAELAAKLPLNALMQARIFAPLGIHAGYGREHFDIPVACGYRLYPFLPAQMRYNPDRLPVLPCIASGEPGSDYLSAAGRLIADADGIAKLLSLFVSREDTPVLTFRSLQEMRKEQAGTGNIRPAGRGLNTAFLPGVFPGFAPVGHQGVAYGMVSEFFADPERQCGVAMAINGAKLVNLHPLQRVGMDLLTLGFHALQQTR